MKLKIHIIIQKSKELKKWLPIKKNIFFFSKTLTEFDKTSVVL